MELRKLNIISLAHLCARRLAYFAGLAHFTARRAGVISLLIAVAVFAAPVTVRAQDHGGQDARAGSGNGVWQVDAQHSVAHLSLGSAPNNAETGVVRVSGTVDLSTTDSAPLVKLGMKPDNTTADYSEINFTGNDAVLTNDGDLAVIGALTVTTVGQRVTMDSPNESYNGAQVSDPAVNNDTREVTLVFAGPGLLAAKNGVAQLSNATTLSRENFPQLVSALSPGNWPSSLVENGICSMPNNLGEDYSGANCTGTSITTSTNSVAPTTAGLGGEGYYGTQPAVTPGRNQATIALDLRVIQQPVTEASSVQIRSLRASN
jgi:polyisoprenoid-binding protein YceI